MRVSRPSNWLSWPLKSRRPYLDIRVLPNHLLRDIGYLDGNDPAGRRK
jgi:hypothetical protein